jgi:hypothetical protein
MLRADQSSSLECRVVVHEIQNTKLMNKIDPAMKQDMFASH